MESLFIYYMLPLANKKGKEANNMGLFGREKITLMLKKYNYTPGETIKGTVTLKLKNQQKQENLK